MHSIKEALSISTENGDGLERAFDLILLDLLEKNYIQGHKKNHQI